MDETEEPGLILGRYKKIKTVKITQSKEIWLAVNKNFGEKAIIKIQPRMLL